MSIRIEKAVKQMRQHFWNFSNKQALKRKTCHLKRMSRRMGHRGELGISVLKEYWNKGVGSRLMEVVIDFANKMTNAEIKD